MKNHTKQNPTNEIEAPNYLPGKTASMQKTQNKNEDSLLKNWHQEPFTRWLMWATSSKEEWKKSKNTITTAEQHETKRTFGKDS